MIKTSIKEIADRLHYIDHISELNKFDFHNARLMLAKISINKIGVYGFTDYMNVKHLVIKI